MTQVKAVPYPLKEAAAKRKYIKMLMTEGDIHCLDANSYVTMLLLGLELLAHGKLVKAKLLPVFRERASAVQEVVS